MRPVLRIAIYCLVSLILLSQKHSSAAEAEGGLTPQMLSELRNSCHMTDHDKAIYNAITANDVQKLALNRDMVNSYNNLFSHKIKTNGITNQKSSGRCWLFAGLNIMRPKMIEKYKLNDFEFSEIYLTFYDKLEKANTFLENIIATSDRDYYDRELDLILGSPFGDGGYWQYVVDLIEKYGVIPKEAMRETYNSNNTRMMDKLISRKLRQDALTLRKMYNDGSDLQVLRTEKEKMLSEIYKMLILNFGEPPKTFTWQYEDRDTVLSKPKVYTPLKFYKDIVGVNLRDYVSLVDHPAVERWKYYQIRLTRNIYDSNDITFINLPIDELKKFALKSVLDDEPVWFANDVGKQNYRDKGLLASGVYDYSPIYETDFGLTKLDKLVLKDSAPNHAMVLIGVDVVKGKPVKWLIENSWGSKRGDNGRWTMYDSWFNDYVYEVVINKKYLPKKILKLLETEPTVLPPWDPMSSKIRIP